MKNLRSIPLLFLLMASSLLFLTRTVKAQETTLLILPSETGTYFKHTFSLYVSIADAHAMFAYDLKVGFKNDTLRLISAIRPPGHFLQPELDPGGEYVASWKLNYGGNSTYQYGHFSYTRLSPGSGAYGGGALIRLTFEAIAAPEWNKTLVSVIDLYDTVIVDDTATSVPHLVIGGSVTILWLPDFNYDGHVNIIELATVAVAFGSTPGDARWYSRADLNMDNVINIIDLVTIALYYGL